MKYALLKHGHKVSGSINYGDHVQSLAAKQFLPQVDFLVERDELNDASYEEAKIIMNSWFTYKPENWPPNPNLKPLFVSFHLNPNYADKLLSNADSVKYLKKHEPIGCRDFRTEAILKKYGIDAYYSFCLTSTLGNTYQNDGGSSQEIIFNDVAYNYLPSDNPVIQNDNLKANVLRASSHMNRLLFKKSKREKVLKELFPEHVRNNAINMTQMTSADKSQQELFEMAHQALLRYSKSKLVVTSRIHCALPCLAMNTPVLFVLDGLKSPKGDLSRLKGTVNYMNVLTTKSKSEIVELLGENVHVIHPSDVDWDNPPKNPTDHINYRDKLIEKCENFIK